MKNVKMSVQGHKLVIEIDLSQDHGLSSTGKTTIIATTEGNKRVEGHDGVMLGLNVYRKKK